MEGYIPIQVPRLCHVPSQHREDHPELSHLLLVFPFKTVLVWSLLASLCLSTASDHTSPESFSSLTSVSPIPLFPVPILIGALWSLLCYWSMQTRAMVSASLPLSRSVLPPLSPSPPIYWDNGIKCLFSPSFPH